MMCSSGSSGCPNNHLNSYDWRSYDDDVRNAAFNQAQRELNVVLGYELDRRNFSKKILSFGLLNETTLKQEGGVGKPAKLYKFNKEKYDQLKKNGLNFEL